MEDREPSGSQEVKAKWDDEEEVDKDHGLLIDSGEGDATKGEEPVSIRTGLSACVKTGDTVICCKTGNNAVQSRADVETSVRQENEVASRLLDMQRSAGGYWYSGWREKSASTDGVGVGRAAGRRREE